MSANLNDLKTRVQESAAEHDRYGSWDGVIYNSSTVIAIVCASLATLLDVPMFWCRLLAGIAAVVIALDRSLSWGARWIFHRQMRHAYLNIEARIAYYEGLPGIISDEERKAQYMEIFTRLYALRDEETRMPGVHSVKEK